VVASLRTLPERKASAVAAPPLNRTRAVLAPAAPAPGEKRHATSTRAPSATSIFPGMSWLKSPGVPNAASNSKSTLTAVPWFTSSTLRTVDSPALTSPKSSVCGMTSSAEDGSTHRQLTTNIDITAAITHRALTPHHSPHFDAPST
jgi:hypothetical protein